MYVDSDVVISSLFSGTGAAYYLLNKSSITPVISSLSVQELKNVISRLNIDQNRLLELTKKHLKLVELKQRIASLKTKYSPYVFDVNDGHIVAGAQKEKVSFLLTYNLKHYKIAKIKDDLNIQVITPALFLQYLRSLEK